MEMIEALRGEVATKPHVSATSYLTPALFESLPVPDKIPLSSLATGSFYIDAFGAREAKSEKPDAPVLNRSVNPIRKDKK